jgi:hypothetical protein
MKDRHIFLPDPCLILPFCLFLGLFPFRHLDLPVLFHLLLAFIPPYYFGLMLIIIINSI